MNLSEYEWHQILKASQRNQLVPFLGAGASSCVLPTGAELVRHLKDVVEYPDPDERDLARVSQYILVFRGREYLTNEIVALMKTRREEHFDSPPHRDLALLPVPIFLTTNYDDLMENELLSIGKSPISLYPIWHTRLEGISEHVLGNQPINEINPSIDMPIVYHLHGHWDVPMSILVTEDDYIQFMSAIYDPNLLPYWCRQALSRESTLVFLGYGLRDWNIRMLLAQHPKKNSSYAIMPRPANGGLAKFLETDLATRAVKILWGTAQDFTNEFLKRWTTTR